MAEYIGLHISRGSVTAARLETGGKKNLLAGSFSAPFEGDAALAGAIGECARRFAASGAEWAVGIPADECSFRHLKFPFKSIPQIRAAVPFELESSLPYGGEEMEFSFLVLGSEKEETSVLACAARRARLDFYRAALKGAGVSARLLLPDSAALLHFYRGAMLPLLHPEPASALIASVDDRALHLCYAGPGGFVDTYVAAPDKREADRFIAALEQPPEKSFLGGPGAVRFSAETSVGWKFRMESAIGGDSPEKLMIPLGLALCAETGHEDLAFPAGTKGRMKFAGSLRFAAIGAAVCVVLFVGFLFFRNFMKQRTLDGIAGRTKAVFTATLPGARPVKPSFQMEQNLKRLESRMRRAGLAPGGRVDFLWLLKRMAETVPDNLPFELDEIVYEEAGITVSGKTDRYESVTRLKELYSVASPFRGAEVLDSKVSPDGRKVNFKLRLQL